MGGAPSPTLCRLTKRAQKRFEVRGDLQAEVMRAVWKLGEATVEDVRATQRPRSASAYTTIQTVLNRLVDRAVLTRVRKGRTFVYSARIGESEYLAQSIGDRLADASPDRGPEPAHVGGGVAGWRILSHAETGARRILIIDA